MISGGEGAGDPALVQRLLEDHGYRDLADYHARDPYCAAQRAPTASAVEGEVRGAAEESMRRSSDHSWRGLARMLKRHGYPNLEAFNRWLIEQGRPPIE